MKEKDTEVMQIDERQSWALERSLQIREGCNHCAFRVMLSGDKNFQRNGPSVFLEVFLFPFFLDEGLIILIYF